MTTSHLAEALRVVRCREFGDAATTAGWRDGAPSRPIVVIWRPTTVSVVKQVDLSTHCLVGDAPGRDATAWSPKPEIPLISRSERVKDRAIGERRGRTMRPTVAAQKMQDWNHRELILQYYISGQ